MRKLIAVTIVMIAGCGGADSIAIADYSTAFRESLCEYLVKCGEIESVTACKKANISFERHFTTSQLAAIQQGKVAYDGGKARSCFDALAERSCDVTSQSNRVVPDACREITRGTQHAGATCGQGEECISTVCTIPNCGMACCQGTCTGDTVPGHAKIGESCETATCEPVAFCDDAIAMCLARKSAGVSCISSTECGFGLDCEPTSGTCLPLPALNAGCSGACRDDGTTCSQATRTCVKVALVDGACTTSADCSPLYRCDTAAKRCTAGVPLGQGCTANQQCADDRAFCDIADGEQTGTCVAPRPVGMPCQRDSSCESRSCDPFSLLCRDEPVCT